MMTTFSEGDDSRIETVTAAMNDSHAAADLRLTKQQLQALRLENQHLKDQVLFSCYINQNFILSKYCLIVR